MILLVLNAVNLDDARDAQLALKDAEMANDRLHLMIDA
jgi:hypothetical protein